MHPQIHDTIKNLDDIIYKTKNFCFLFWGGSLALIVQYMDKEMKASLILLTALIPLLFRAMDYRWRKHLMQCRRPERHISHFLNSEAFERLVLEGRKKSKASALPLLARPFDYDEHQSRNPIQIVHTQKPL